MRRNVAGGQTELGTWQAQTRPGVGFRKGEVNLDSDQRRGVDDSSHGLTRGWSA